MSFGRWGNVSGVLLFASVPGALAESGLSRNAQARTAALACLLDDLFSETLWVGGDSSLCKLGRHVSMASDSVCTLRGLLAALDAATSERVIVLGSNNVGLSIDLLLALAAWPEADAVVFSGREEGESLCAIYRREVVSSIARKRVGEGRLSVGEFHGAVRAESVSLIGLGLVDPSCTDSRESAAMGSENPAEVR